MKGCIYTITNKINNKVYVGKTYNLEKRIYDHLYDLRRGKHHSHKLQRSFDKYGEDNFIYDYNIYEIENDDELSSLEIKIIQKYDSYNNGYNETLGGEGRTLIINFEERVLVYNILQKYNGVKRLIARYYNCDDSVIAAIEHNSLYKKEKFSQEEYLKLINLIGITEKNLKENYIPHNLKKLNKEQCFEILSVITWKEGYDKTLCQIFQIDSKITYRLRRKMIYKDYIQEFEILTDEEKENIRNRAFDKYNIEGIKSQRGRRCVKNPLTQEQVNYILDNKGLKTQKQIGIDLGISSDRVSSVQRGISYKDLIEVYNKNK